MYKKSFKYFFVFLFSLSFAEVIISPGVLNAQLIRQQQIIKTPLLSTLTMELDSYPISLFFENDFVSYGINLISEFSYHENELPSSVFIFYYPVFFNYYLQVNNQLFVGGGLSLGLSQATVKSSVHQFGQQLGYHFFIRKILQKKLFLELGFQTAIAKTTWNNEQEVDYQLEGLFLKINFVF